jgi:hypothetical protein
VASLDLLDPTYLDLCARAHNDELHCLALAQDISQGRMDRAESYAGKCVAEMERRKAQANAPAAADEAPPVLPSKPGDPPKIGAPVEAPPGAVPSFLQPKQLPAPPLGRPPAELAATAGVFELPSALRGGAVPFHRSPAPSPFAHPSTPKPGRADDHGMGETLPLGGTLPLSAPLPFAAGREPPSAPTFPRMPLETYAAFCAERTLFPDRIGEVQKKYNIRSDAARVALDQDWQARFEAHPDTKAEWQRCVAHHREWLQRQPRE